MGNEELLEDPTNRVVCVFDEQQQAEAARQSLIDFGFDGEQIRLCHGSDAAEGIDTSAKWFADTDAEIKRYAQELRAGNSVLSVPISDADCREKVDGIVKRHAARLVTHFGQWITEMMK